MIAKLAAALGVFVLLAAGSAAAAPPLKPEQRLRADGDFSGKKPGKTAVDLSGLACMPAATGTLRCLVINDEGSFAQFARIAENRVTPGASVPLLGDKASDTTLGAPPRRLCKAQGAFAELDGEAVTYAGGAFYIAGSHGCSRHKGEFRLSAFHLARLRVDEAGAPSGQVELTYRLSDMLRQAGDAAPFFGKGLIDQNGLNLEGVAVTGPTLWAGLRAPSLAGRAFLVGAPVEALFAPGNSPATVAPTVIAFEAGRDRGIRDLAALPDGRLLALLGPALDQPLPYSLLLVDPARPGDARTLGDLPVRSGQKAEAVTILGQRAGGLDILIGYDGARNGAFERYRIPLP
ncbi:DUF3616 domain-containing protein [Bosea sp. (in: a-proteobacteria)]|uniref:DUF3616 domain-containing protein n=1 Tax=Bosea sp. (in: a-proteobacteria) TaxID=1871050 RepID=UPI002FCABC32